MVGGVAGLGGFLAAKAEDEGSVMKEVFLRGPGGSSLVRGYIFRVAFCPHQPSLPNLPLSRLPACGMEGPTVSQRPV